VKLLPEICLPLVQFVVSRPDVKEQHPGMAINQPPSIKHLNTTAYDPGGQQLGESKEEGRGREAADLDALTIHGLDRVGHHSGGGSNILNLSLCRGRKRANQAVPIRVQEDRKKDHKKDKSES